MLHLKVLLFVWSLAAASRLKPTAGRIGLSNQNPGSDALMACEWTGPARSGVRLRFPLASKRCDFDCKGAKFQGFAQRFVDAFSTEHDGSRCHCVVKGRRDHMFSFKGSRGHCTADMCWDVYVKHADLGAKHSERVGLLDNYATGCEECGDADCDQLHVKPIGFSKEQKDLIFHAAASGDADAQQVKEVIEVYDVEAGSAVVEELDAQIQQLLEEDEDRNDELGLIIDEERDPLEVDESHVSLNGSIGNLGMEDSIDSEKIITPSIPTRGKLGCDYSIPKGPMPTPGKIGDTCILHSLYTLNFIFHKKTITSSTCGQVRALKRRDYHSVTSSTEQYESIDLWCYSPDGRHGEKPEVGGEGVCHVPKRKPCGGLDKCSCRPGSQCAEDHESGGILHGGLGFATTIYACQQIPYE